jgi:hypothetical protein
MFAFKSRRNIVAFFLIAIPIFSLALNALSWLRFGLDLPCLDDWEEYYHQSATSMAFGHLFAPGNDTLYPVGRALDVLAQRLLNGNSVAYQLISMVGVLGCLLFLQWKLLSLTIEDSLSRASAFGLSVFMMCPYTYWGWQNCAYHQALPTVCILAILCILIIPAQRHVAGIVSVGVAGLISGLSYISGAISILAIAIGVLCLVILNPNLREPVFIRRGLTLLVVGTVTTAVQLATIVFHQGGNLHRADAHWVMPYDGDYWMFMLGKIGRALSLQDFSTSVSFFVALLVALALVVVFVLGFLTLIRAQSANTPKLKLALVYYLLFIVVFVYLNAISAGRAGLRPDDVITPYEVFRFGFANRYHFFWITLLFPWLAAAVYSLVSEFGRFQIPVSPAAISLLCMGLGYQGGVFGHASDYRGISARRSSDIECLQQKIADRGSIDCRSVFPANLSTAFVYARSIGSSFTRYLPIRDYSEGDKSPPLFRLSTSRVGISSQNATRVDSSSGDFEFVSKEDPQIYISLAPDIKLGSCLIVQFWALVRAATADTAQVFYETPDAVGFSERLSRTRPLAATGTAFTRLTFVLESTSGFVSPFRFDVVQKSQDFAIRDIELRCLLWN